MNDTVMGIVHHLAGFIIQNSTKEISYTLPAKGISSGERTVTKVFNPVNIGILKAIVANAVEKEYPVELGEGVRKLNSEEKKLIWNSIRISISPDNLFTLEEPIASLANEYEKVYDDIKTMLCK